MSEGLLNDDVLARCVGELIEDGDGFWRSCSGCYETEDGHPVGRYPYSPALRCDLGGGCGECGGLGAVWDSTDYEAMVNDMMADEKRRASRHRLSRFIPVVSLGEWSDHDWDEDLRLAGRYVLFRWRGRKIALAFGWRAR